MSDAGTAAAGAAGAGAAEAPTIFSADPNYAKLDPALQSAFKSKGWDAKTPFEVAVESMKSYTEAERHIGTPTAQLLRMPKDAADVEGWKAFNAKLGVPEKPEGYDFSKIKRADGTDLDGQFIDTMRQVFLAEGIPAARAPGLVSQIVKFIDGAEADETAVQTAELAKQKDALGKSWGNNKEANTFIVRQAVVKLGLDENIVGAIEQSAGYEKTMQALLKIGQMMGEDKFVQNSNTLTPGVMTREQAQARLADLKADAVWVKKLTDGDRKANEEFDALTRLLV